MSAPRPMVERRPSSGAPVTPPTPRETQGTDTDHLALGRLGQLATNSKKPDYSSPPCGVCSLGNPSADP